MEGFVSRHIASVMLLAFSVAANAFTLQYHPNVDYVPTVQGGGGRTDLNPDHVWRILGTHTHAQTAKSLIEAEWSDWVVSTSSTAAPGTVTVNVYKARQTYNGGNVISAGAHLDLNYESTDSSFSNYRFVQVIYTNSPLGGATSPYLDPQPNDDSLPFYWTESEHSSEMQGSSYHFSDLPSRAYDGSQSINWAAALWLCEWTQSNNVNYLTIRDGVYWGWGTWSFEESPPDDPPGEDKLSAVPEPSTVGILSLAIVAFKRTRRIRRCC